MEAARRATEGEKMAAESWRAWAMRTQATKMVSVVMVGSGLLSEGLRATGELLRASQMSVGVFEVGSVADMLL